MDARERWRERLRETLAAGCACTAGCPSCVDPHNEAGGNPKQAAVRMLERLLGVAAGLCSTGAGWRFWRIGEAPHADLV